MSTPAPEIPADVHADALSPRRWAQLEAFANKHSLSLDAALRRAVDLSDTILDALDEPDSHVYVYRQGKRYSLKLYPLDSAT